MDLLLKYLGIFLSNVIGSVVMYISQWRMGSHELYTGKINVQILYYTLRGYVLDTCCILWAYSWLWRNSKWAYYLCRFTSVFTILHPVSSSKMYDTICVPTWTSVSVHFIICIKKKQVETLDRLTVSGNEFMLRIIIRKLHNITVL